MGISTLRKRIVFRFVTVARNLRPEGEYRLIFACERGKRFTLVAERFPVSRAEIFSLVRNGIIYFLADYEVFKSVNNLVRRAVVIVRSRKRRLIA